MCTGSALMLNSCIDDSYDLNKVDMTMGLGSDGLGVKLGNTEKVLLDSLLDLDESVKTDQSNLYYLVKSGTTNFSVNVDNVTTIFKKTKLVTQDILTYDDVKEQIAREYGKIVDDDRPLPIGSDFLLKNEAQGEESIDFTVTDIRDVAYIEEVDVANNIVISLKVSRNNTPENLALGVSNMKNVDIILPAFLKVINLKDGWTLNSETNTLHCNNYACNNLSVGAASEEICSMVLDKVAPKRNVPANGTLTFTGDEAKIKMTCQEVTFRNTAGRDIEMKTGNKASICLNIDISNTNLTLNSVTGKFNQVIEPSVDPIDIQESLPDFLTDEDVVINATNPTIRFNSNMTNIPVGVQLGGELKSVFDNDASLNQSVVLPTTAKMKAGQNNIVYFYQGSEPYDPELNAATVATDKAQASNLSNLIKKLPSRIEVNLDNGDLKVDDSNLYTIQLNKEYKAQADYSVFVPFEFKGGLTIVYNDSTNSFNDDLKDYAADGIRITSTANSTVPLDLTVHLDPVDVNGNTISGITFTDPATGKDAVVKGSSDGTSVQNTELTIEANLTDPSLLKKLDRIYFKVRAANEDDTTSQKLVSTQYLKFNDIRLRLKGQVIADFN